MRHWGIPLLMLFMFMAGATGCAKKKAASDPAIEMEKKAAAEQAAAEAWMKQGTFVPAKPEWQVKITQALEKMETLQSCQVGIYSDELGQALEFDGEIHGQDAYFRFNRNHQEVPTEFILLEDRLYMQEGDGFSDQGPKSRSAGEKLYQPLLKDIRISILQALRGEMKDLGPALYEDIPVHKYDARVAVPGNPPGLLTATVEIDEANGRLMHAVVGQGTGSDSSKDRFQKFYRELLYTRINQVPVIQIPAGVPVTPYQEDLDSKKMGLP